MVAQRKLAVLRQAIGSYVSVVIALTMGVDNDICGAEFVSCSRMHTSSNIEVFAITSPRNVTLRRISVVEDLAVEHDGGDAQLPCKTVRLERYSVC